MRGVYQHCSKKYLHRYLAEFDFRYSNQSALGVEDTERAVTALRGVVGKRLTYHKPDGGAKASKPKRKGRIRSRWGTKPHRQREPRIRISVDRSSLGPIYLGSESGFRARSDASPAETQSFWRGCRKAVAFSQRKTGFALVRPFLHTAPAFQPVGTGGRS